VSRVLFLRECSDADAPFVWRTFVAALGPYVTATWGWDEVEQRRRFAEWFVPATHQIVTVDNCDVGFLRVERTPDEIFLASLQLLPEHQRRAIGTEIALQLLEEARASRRSVRLTVLRVNPARALYERLGFGVIGETATHFEMRAVP